MSKLRRECEKCTNNQRCIADYGSIFCMLNRKYEFNNVDFAEGEDKTTNSIILESAWLERRIEQLEYKLSNRQYKDYKERYEISGKIKAYKTILNL